MARAATQFLDDLISALPLMNSIKTKSAIIQNTVLFLSFLIATLNAALMLLANKHEPPSLISTSISSGSSDAF